VAGVAPRSQPRCLFQRQVDPPQVEQQPEVLEIIGAIAAIAVFSPFGSGQPALWLRRASRITTASALWRWRHREPEYVRRTISGAG
jgi:hypothetical protein